MPFKLTRRDVLAAGLGGALAGGAGLVLGAFYGVRRERHAKRVPPREEPFAPSVFLAIAESGVVTIWLTKSEMGQGVATALPQIVAHELDADWSLVRVEQAIANRNYGDQTTVASASVASMFDELRRAGAAAREMLIAAAARVWDVPPSECDAADGFVVHRPSGRRLGYGPLAPLAAELDVPDAPRVKERGASGLLGRALPRVDTPEKVDGSARFGLDVRLPGMVFAALARAPVNGSALERFDERAARAVTGVIDVVRTSASVAVIATSTWAAFRGVDALAATFRAPPTPIASSAQLFERMRAMVDEPGAIATDGDVSAITRAPEARRVRATYELPLLAHQTMEPPNATVHHEPAHDPPRCRIWAPTQDPQGCQWDAAETLGLPGAQIEVRTTWLGGGFGRRASRDEVREAVEIARAIAPRPVQLVWRREDDLRADFYRPPAVVRLDAALDDAGAVTALHARVVGPSLSGADSARGEVCALAVDGIESGPYAWPALRVEWQGLAVPVRLGIWRSVGHSVNAFAMESFVDELAVRAGVDPIAMRRALIPNGSRARGVLERALALADAAGAAPEGRARGVAVHACFGSFVALVLEASGAPPRAHRAWAAIDCGTVVNPGIVRAQVEGGIAFALSAALHGRIDVEDGAVVQSNFHDAPILRIDAMPEVELAIAESDEPPSGVGELVVPVVAPALANALAQLGARPRTLPIA
ncbi:xanthine dehydrogenase family protein molybdopterin-binding subunit [Sandaracinus amylolyticus]|uniref:Isoquinoline 1-oxidoreductase beta subunit n=1 Tax=Sandaracinus amylolyticus TaxID=927083 RepID=A0A0F6W7Q7_9BACT|nr:molybdopterin cofactor-binding domain-containing protein [Sandaracinus amylolyticus]AKF09421.1 Isoquinoline 1-oxidoreductase beta subunit [Sandaracinus amylolyticus]